MRELSLTNCRLDDRYDVIRRLGRGSYAEIYVAEDVLAARRSVHREVVVKALNVFMNNDLDNDLEQTLVENFENEAVALDRVRHRNIISRLGHGTARDLAGTVFHYLILEFLPGGDLAGYCRTHGLGVSEALFYLKQVCAGLAYAHERGIIHRDIKPQNLLLSADKKVVKIADFGVARLSQAEGPITRVGTNLYAPPEHSPMFAGATGKLEFAELTAAADIYSLAKTAYVLITSESPRFFANQPITALPHSVRREPWSAPLLSVLKKATSADPRDRHQNVAEFWKELEEIGNVARKGPSVPAFDPPPVLRPVSAPALSSNLPGKTPQPADFRPAGMSYKKTPLRVIENERPRVLIRDVTPTVGEVSPPATFPAVETANSEKKPEANGSARRRWVPRGLVIASLLIVLFASGLFLTYNLVLTAELIPSIGSLFSRGEATALVNINLRADPSTRNRRIGLVPKGSRLRILGNEQHWYRVVILEYGSPKANPGFEDSGWISGKTRTGLPTIELDNTR